MDEVLDALILTVLKEAEEICHAVAVDPKNSDEYSAGAYGCQYALHELMVRVKNGEHNKAV